MGPAGLLTVFAVWAVLIFIMEGSGRSRTDGKSSPPPPTEVELTPEVEWLAEDRAYERDSPWH